MEKAIKAVLALAGVEFPRTHDLGFLVARATENGVEVPNVVGETEWLTPWAAQLRYDEPPTALDREVAVSVAEAAVAWAREILDC